MWIAHDISKKTKVCFCICLLRSHFLLYYAQSWTLKEHKRKLKVFEMSVFRKIVGVTQHDRRRHVDILKALDDKDITERRKNKTVNVFCHESHTPAEDSHITLCGCIDGSRTRGRPKQNWFNIIKEDRATIV